MNTMTRFEVQSSNEQTLGNLFESGIVKDVFALLGPHQIDANQFILRVFLPTALSVKVYSKVSKTPLLMTKVEGTALFILEGTHDFRKHQYLLEVEYQDSTIKVEDPYRFESPLNSEAMYLFNEGTLEHAYKHLGAHFITLSGTEGVHFSVWAPNARSVSVIGDFNCWQPNQHFLRLHPASGVWDIFIPNLKTNQRYKFHITVFDGSKFDKADPFARKMEQAPGTASILQPPLKHTLQVDQDKKALRNSITSPISIYEVHLGSWKRRANEGGRYLTYRELADDLVNYVKELGFTHIQLMPISEFPFDGSWGYQPVGLFSPTSRHGSVEDFQYLVKKINDANLGLLIDWVPGHFPSDPHGLYKFDGTHLFEHADTRQGFHPDWNTYIYNYERAEVKSFILSNALYWLNEFKVDGLRVDAVASMLYLDYSREDGEWIPNHYGGRENLGAIESLKQVNTRCYANEPHSMMVAEESTAWPGVTNNVDNGGLGFGYKWNMGWMNDTLQYMSKDPIYRKHHHHEMTFSMVYAYSENYILPLSHDEVVHGKGSLLSKMPGDDWQQFANLRAYYGFMYAHPGKKLLFMGSELAPRNEWDHETGLDWNLLESEAHKGIQSTVKVLNTVYRNHPALYECDNSPLGFRWIDSHNAEQSIFSFIRYGKDASKPLVVVSNFTPSTYHHYRIGLPTSGVYQVVFNSDSINLFGSGVNPIAHSQQMFESELKPSHDFEQSAEISIPPLSTIYLQLISE